MVELGFIDYVKKTKNTTADRLFPKLRFHPIEERYNTDYNKAFMKFFRKNITNDPSQVFHSFRHIVGDQLLKNAVKHRLPKALMNQIMGHQPDRDETTQTYSQGYGLEELYEGIKTISYA
jgi:integrase